MDKPYIIAGSVSAAVVLGLVLYMFKKRKWSDGTSIVYKDEAEENILDEFKPLMTRKGGKRKKHTKKHYK